MKLLWFLKDKPVVVSKDLQVCVKQDIRSDEMPAPTIYKKKVKESRKLRIREEYDTCDKVYYVIEIYTYQCGFNIRGFWRWRTYDVEKYTSLSAAKKSFNATKKNFALRDSKEIILETKL